MFTCLNQYSDCGSIEITQQYPNSPAARWNCNSFVSMTQFNL